VAWINDLIAEPEGAHLEYGYAAPFGPALLVTQGTTLKVLAAQQNPPGIGGQER
jgi:hypothetical protein